MYFGWKDSWNGRYLEMYWVMENFPITEARSQDAKLWCEKWDLQKLMDLRKSGHITDVLETQLAILPSGDDIPRIGNGEGDNDEENDEKNDEEDESADGNAEEDVKLIAENIRLKAELKKRNASLTMKDEHYQELQKTLMQKEEENKTLLKRLSNQSSQIEELFREKEKLMDENIELTVQQTMQKMYVGRETVAAAAVLTSLCHEMDDIDTLKNLSGETLVADTANQPCMSDHEVIDTQNKDEKRTQDESPETKPKQAESPNSKVERLKSKVRTEALKRGSFVYGAEAEGKRKRRCKSIAKRQFSKKSMLYETKIKKMSDSKHINDEQIHKMSVIESSVGSNYMLVYFTHRKDAAVTLEDIYNIMNGQMISSLVINAHAELLMLKYNTQDENKIAIFDSTIWSFVKTMNLENDPNITNRKHFIDNALKKYPRTELFMFPITTNRGKQHTTDPDHWTLLVFDMDDPKWLFYNSLKSRGRYNLYKNDAELLRKYLELKFRTDWQEANRDEMSDPEVASNDNTQYHTYQFLQPTFPQQASGSLDCGVFVCYAMEQLAKQEPIPNKLTLDELLQYKV